MKKNNFKKMVTTMIGVALFILGIITMCISADTTLIGAVIMIAGIVAIIIANKIGKNNNEIKIDIEKVQKSALIIGVGILLNSFGIGIMTTGPWIIGLGLIFAGIISFTCLIPVLKGLN